MSMKHRQVFIFITKIFSFIILVLILTACSTAKAPKQNHEAQFAEAQKLISEKRLPEAKVVLTDLCEHDYGAGCAVLGGLLHFEHKDNYSLFYQKACDLKDGLGCFGLASIQYKNHQNELFGKNIKLSCLYGFTEACRVMDKIKADNSKAKAKR